MNQQNDSIGRRLEQDARTPDFSAELHARTMRRLRQQRVRTALAPSSTRHGHWLAPLSAAAAALLISGALWWSGDYRPMLSQPATPTAPLAIAAPEPLAMLRKGSEPFRLAFSNTEPVLLGSVTRDARSFAGYVVRQLPTIRDGSANRVEQPM